MNEENRAAHGGVTDLAHRARTAAQTLAQTHRDHKDRGLHALADAVAAAEQQILTANATDVAAAEQNETPAALIDRLRLTSDRIAGMTDGLRALSGLSDPVGDVVRGWSTPAGVAIRQIRVPLGVVASSTRPGQMSPPTLPEFA